MQYQPVHANNAYFPAGQQPPHVPAQYQTQRPSQEYQPQPQQQPGPGQYGMHPQQLGTTHSHSPAGAFQPIGYQGQAAGVYGQQQPVYQTHPQHQTQPQNFYATQGVPATTGALPNDAAVGAPPQQMHPAGVSVGTEEQPLISFDWDLEDIFYVFSFISSPLPIIFSIVYLRLYFFLVMISVEH